MALLIVTILVAMVCCSMTAPLTASYRSGDISRHLLPSQKQTRMENSGRIIGSAYSMRQPVKISQHVKFGNRALPYFHRNRLIQMAAEVDEVPGEGFGRRGKKRRRREAQDNEDRAKTSDEMIAENPLSVLHLLLDP
mmetsp:Transcript_11158/g.17835  ORF Transcript_11158/g.17835 Transcript_11158/m.17835 type:complete len:137 (-) Transcript_11158:495-905(-)